MKFVDLMNSKNGKEVEDKVLSFALEQIASKFVGSGPVLGMQVADGYFNGTAMGLNDMANAEYKEMIFNRSQYQVTKDEMYLKRESQASQRMHQYLIKMNEIIRQNK